MIFARFLVAGAITFPVLLRAGLPDLGGIGLRRALILTILGGAPFALLQADGYGFAPLAHGAVIAPSTISPALASSCWELNSSHGMISRLSAPASEREWTTC